MKCKICGSEDIAEENGQYVCKSCGSVFFEAPTDGGDEVIKSAKEAIEAKEAEDAAKIESEKKAAEEAERILKEQEAQLAEKALKNAEEKSAEPNVTDIPVSELFKNAESSPAETEAQTDAAEELSQEITEPPRETANEAPLENSNPALENAGDEKKPAENQDEVKIFKKGEPLYTPQKMSDGIEELEKAFSPESEKENGKKEEKSEKKKDKKNKDKKEKKNKKRKNKEIEEAKAMDGGETVTAENIDESDDDGKKKKKSPMREFLDFCLPIIIALIVAMLLKSFVFANAQVPTGSMLNTIQEGDRIIASRLEYKFHDPERYDIIIFKFPDDVAAHEKDPSVKVEYFVKRIIGLPGETVTIVNGVVYVTDKDGNTQQLRDDFVTACVPTGNFGPYEVPENSYFVMGDNRESSIDSRYWETTHYVDKDLIIGKVKFRYYPSFGKLE